MKSNGKGTNQRKKKLEQHTYERRDDENNVESQTSAGSCKESGNMMIRDDDGADGDGQDQLDSYNRIHFPNERPPELRALQHCRIQRRRPGLLVTFPVRMVPHLSDQIEEISRLQFRLQLEHW